MRKLSALSRRPSSLIPGSGNLAPWFVLSASRFEQQARAPYILLSASPFVPIRHVTRCFALLPLKASFSRSSCRLSTQCLSCMDCWSEHFVLRVTIFSRGVPQLCIWHVGWHMRYAGHLRLV